MFKPGLGKGLGELMNGDQAAGKRPGASQPKGLAVAAVPEVELGRGLNTLVSAKPAKPAELPAGKSKQILPAWFFFSADLLLLAYTVAITFEAPRPFDLGTVLFCAVSIGLGCALGVAGVWRMGAGESEKDS